MRPLLREGGLVCGVSGRGQGVRDMQGSKIVVVMKSGVEGRMQRNVQLNNRDRSHRVHLRELILLELGIFLADLETSIFVRNTRVFPEEAQDLAAAFGRKVEVVYLRGLLAVLHSGVMCSRKALTCGMPPMALLPMRGY